MGLLSFLFDLVGKHVSNPNSVSLTGVCLHRKLCHPQSLDRVVILPPGSVLPRGGLSNPGLGPGAWLWAVPGDRPSA